jgi:CheY-like chemotaxis protein
MKKILIIDDDASFVEAQSMLLEARGYSIISAENGTIGFEKAQKEKPDLIILDVMMTSKTEGFNVARSLRDNFETKLIPIVMVTGIRRDMNLPFGFEKDDSFLPVKTVLEKPVKPEALIKAVEENLK